MSTVRYVLADPQPFFREVLSGALDDTGSLRCVGSVGDEESAYSLAEDVDVDLVLTEVELERGSGLHLAARLAGRVPVLIVTRHPEGHVLMDAAAAGASGCVGHATSLQTLVALMDDVGHERFRVDESRLRDALVAAGSTWGRPSATGLQLLTVREREILFSIASGADDEQIAQNLYISRHTVRTHVGNVLRKLGVHSRAEAARLAFASGLERGPVGDRHDIEGPAWIA